MENNIFLGGGFFGSRQLPVVGPSLGQPVRYPPPVWDYRSKPWGTPSRGPDYPVEWPVYRSNQAQVMTRRQTATSARPTSQPIAASPSDVHCYYCEGLPDFPTYWMSESQASQWNRDRDARCNQVNSSECQKKYNQMQANQQASIRRTGFNAFNLPGSTTFASAMSGRIRVQNPELIG